MKRNALGVIFFVVLIDLIGFGIVIPMMPYYAKSFGSNAFDLGLLMMVYSAMQLIFAPFWGSLSDRYGRRPILLTTIAGTAASLLLLAAAPSYSILFLGRVLGGFFGANISTATAYITDITDEKNRSKGMGMIGASFGLGFILGPAIGGILSQISFSTPFYFAGLLSFANFIFAAFQLKESNPSVEDRLKKRPPYGKFSWKLWQRALSLPSTGTVIVTFFFVTWAVTQMEVSFALYLLGRFGWTSSRAGVLLAAMGLLMAVIQGGLIGRLTKKFGERNLVRVGIAICSVSLTLFGFATTPAMLILALIFLGLGHGISQPSLSSLASKGAPSDQRGAVMGVYHSAGSLARVIGPPTAGFLFDRVSMSAPFFTGVIILATGMAYQLRRGIR